jgi:hypothetical protein
VTLGADAFIDTLAHRPRSRFVHSHSPRRTRQQEVPIASLPRSFWVMTRSGKWSPVRSTEELYQQSPPPQVTLPPSSWVALRSPAANAERSPAPKPRAPPEEDHCLRF